MSQLGGRPKEEGGHDNGPHLSLDKETRDILAKLKEKGKQISPFVEKSIKTNYLQLDPGPACNTVKQVIDEVEGALDDARAKGEFDRVQVLAQLRSDLAPYASMCEFKPDKPDKGSANEKLQ